MSTIKQMKCTGVEPGFAFTVGKVYEVTDSYKMNGHTYAFLENDNGAADIVCLTCQKRAQWDLIEADVEEISYEALH